MRLVFKTFLSSSISSWILAFSSKIEIGDWTLKVQRDVIHLYFQIRILALLPNLHLRPTFKTSLAIDRFFHTKEVLLLTDTKTSLTSKYFYLRTIATRDLEFIIIFLSCLASNVKLKHLRSFKLILSSFFFSPFHLFLPYPLSLVFIIRSISPKMCHKGRIFFTQIRG